MGKVTGRSVSIKSVLYFKNVNVVSYKEFWMSNIRILLPYCLL